MSYNGHKNWNHWNVALWIGNDEALYTFVKDRILYGKNRGYTRDDIARAIVKELAEDRGITSTPDGAPYTYSSVRAAIRDL